MTQQQETIIPDDMPKYPYLMYLRAQLKTRKIDVPTKLYLVESTILIEYHIRDVISWDLYFVASGMCDTGESDMQRRAGARIYELMDLFNCDPLLVAEIYRRVGEELVPLKVEHGEGDLLKGVCLRRYSEPDGPPLTREREPLGNEEKNAMDAPYMKYLSLALKVPDRVIKAAISPSEVDVLIEHYLDRWARLEELAERVGKLGSWKVGIIGSAKMRINEIIAACALESSLIAEMQRRCGQSAVDSLPGFSAADLLMYRDGDAVAARA